MKKVLALVVAFALCFTAVAGCFAVSATAPVISINTDADTSFDISGTNYTAKIAQITELTVQNGLAVVDIYNGETKLVEYTPELDDEDEPEFDWVRSTDEDSNTVIKFLNVINAGESFTYTVNVDVENAQPGDYAITATIEAGDYEAEEIIDVADASAIFTVEAPHTCAPYGEPVVENKVDATCTTDGSYDSVVYCECGEEISRTPVTVPATGHTDGEVVEENNVAPTCTVDGSYDSVVYCSVCNAEISRTTVTVPATGHNYGTPVDNGDGTHTATCANNCGIPATEEHSYTEGTCACGKTEEVACQHEHKTIISATPATETETGFIDYDCPDCDDDDAIDQVVYYIRYARTNSISVSGESEILYCVGVRDADAVRTGATGSNETWSDMFVKFTEDRVGEDDVVTYMSYTDKRVEDTTMGSNAVMKFSYGVAPKFLGNVITTNTFIYNDKDGKWYSGTPSANSVKDYVGKSLPNATSDEQKTLLVDLLNYGAAAQIKFKYDVENLVNASFVWNNVDYSEYATEELVSPIVYQGVLASSSTEEYPLTVSSFGVQAESKLVLTVNFQFGNKYYANYTSEYENMYVEVSYTDIDGVLQTVTYYNATSNPDAEYTFSSTDNTRKFALEFDSFAAADMRSVVTVKVYTGAGTLLNSTSEYSIQSYVYSQNENSTDTELLAALEAMIIYGDSANAFLSK